MAHKVSCHLGAGLFWDVLSWLVVGLLFWAACNCQGLSELIYNFLR